MAGHVHCWHGQQSHPDPSCCLCDGGGCRRATSAWTESSEAAPLALVRDLAGFETPTELMVLATGYAALVEGWGHVITVPVKGEWRACFAQANGSILDRTAKVVGDNVEVEVLPNASGEDRIVAVFVGLAATQAGGEQRG